MSMNINNSNQPPAEPKPNKKSNVKLAVGVTLGIIGALAFLWLMTGAANTINSSASYQAITPPTAAEITQKCTDKVRELMGPELTNQYSIDVCVRAFNSEMNDPSHISANPTTAEIREFCTKHLRNELGSDPPVFAVNMCVGTALAGLNK